MNEDSAAEMVAVNSEAEPIVVLNSDCQYVGANQKALDLHRRERDELLGLSGDDVLADSTVECGRDFQRVLDGSTIRRTNEIRRGDGTRATLENVLEHVELHGDDFVEVHIKDTIESEENTSLSRHSREIMNRRSMTSTERNWNR